MSKECNTIIIRFFYWSFLLRWSDDRCTWSIRSNSTCTYWSRCDWHNRFTSFGLRTMRSYEKRKLISLYALTGLNTWLSSRNRGCWCMINRWFSSICWSWLSFIRFDSWSCSTCLFLLFCCTLWFLNNKKWTLNHLFRANFTWSARRSALFNWTLGGILCGGPVGFCWIFVLARRSSLNAERELV